MSLEKAIEQIILEGMARGDFDDLRGKGKPLDLTDYFTTPEDVRMGFSILKANDFVPEEIELMKEIAALRQRAAAGDADGSDIKELRDKTLALSLLLEKRKRRA